MTGIEEVMEQASAAMGNGDFKSAMESFEQGRQEFPEAAELHFGWAEAAFLQLTVEMDEEVREFHIKKAYEKACELDEENLEYVGGLANFALDCGRIPLGIKEYKRLEKMAEIQGTDAGDILYDAAKQVIDAVERIDRNAPNALPFLKQALHWAVNGLGFTKEEALEFLSASDE